MRFKKLVIPVAFATSMMLVSSCSRKVTRIDPSQQVDLSGNWNSTDARQVAEEMTGTILNATW